MWDVASRVAERRLLGHSGRKRVALKRTVSELRTLYYTNLYQIYHMNSPVSRTFEMVRIEKGGDRVGRGIGRCRAPSSWTLRYAQHGWVG